MNLFIDDDPTPDDETVGQLHGRLPEGEWVSAYGVWFKRLPQPPDVTGDRQQLAERLGLTTQDVAELDAEERHRLAIEAHYEAGRPD